MTDTPLLLTPGPLTVSPRVRAAMDRDWGSRDPDFIALTARIRSALLEIAGADPEEFTAVLLQGAGTFAVEAMIASFAPTDGETLVVQNGAYGRRAADILRRLGRPFRVLALPETGPVDVEAVVAALPGAAAVLVVHCETTTGVLNPTEALAEAAKAACIPLLLDAMSGFGALPLDLSTLPLTAVAASSNKCLQGVPGIGFVICDKAALAASKGRAPSISLDLHDQAKGFDATGEWRFTPPTHVVAALGAAIDELMEEGGRPAREARYRANLKVLLDGMRALGFELLLNEADQAPIIVTFEMPEGDWFVFPAFYEALKARGFMIYPGKLTERPSFRIGCIGDVHPADMERFLAAVKEVVGEMRG